jgi:hypothetical protein
MYIAPQSARAHTRTRRTHACTHASVVVCRSRCNAHACVIIGGVWWRMCCPMCARCPRHRTPSSHSTTAAHSCSSVLRTSTSAARTACARSSLQCAPHVRNHTHTTSARAHTHTHLQACSRARARLTLAGARVSVAREPGGGSYEPLESRVLQVQRLVNWVASELRVPVAYEHTVEKECRYRTRLGRCSASASASADDDADDGDDVVPPGVFDMDNMHCRATHVRARARARVRCAGPALTMRRCSGRA